ncbi:hypothetical protein [Aurantimicrobium minutum]|uniref:hypothetical protein n=1 Tax=Aurantimicrobium minutum TaxID=708131 RepID=UPI000BBB6241|nr:hypothetical protein [Aurantimicrobium minutum]
MAVAIPIALYLILVFGMVGFFIVIAVAGLISLVIAAISARGKEEAPLPPPPFEPYMIYIPRPGCGGCGMAFLTDEEYFCRWCGTQREYQEIEIAYKGNLKRINRKY